MGRRYVTSLLPLPWNICQRWPQFVSGDGSLYYSLPSDLRSPSIMPSSGAVLCCCSDKRKTAGSGIRYFRFTKDKQLQQQWIRACDRPDNINIVNAIVCSRHLKEDYQMKYQLLGKENTKYHKLLKKDAVPSQFISPGMYRSCWSSLVLIYIACHSYLEIVINSLLPYIIFFILLFYLPNSIMSANQKRTKESRACRTMFPVYQACLI